MGLMHRLSQALPCCRPPNPLRSLRAHCVGAAEGATPSPCPAPGRRQRRLKLYLQTLIARGRNFLAKQT